MSSGKVIAQAGHAYVGALKSSAKISPKTFRSYVSADVETKLSLDGGTEANLLILHEKLSQRCIPSFLVYDHGHVELPDFDGSRKLTALGVGPLTKSQSPSFLKKLPLWGSPRSKGGAP